MTFAKSSYLSNAPSNHGFASVTTILPVKEPPLGGLSADISRSHGGMFQMELTFLTSGVHTRGAAHLGLLHMRPVRRCGDQAVVRRDGTASRKFEIRSFQLHNHKIGCIEHLQFKAAPAVQRDTWGMLTISAKPVGVYLFSALLIDLGQTDTKNQARAMHCVFSPRLKA